MSDLREQLADSLELLEYDGWRLRGEVSRAFLLVIADFIEAELAQATADALEAAADCVTRMMTSLFDMYGPHFEPMNDTWLKINLPNFLTVRDTIRALIPADIDAKAKEPDKASWQMGWTQGCADAVTACAVEMFEPPSSGILSDELRNRFQQQVQEHDAKIRREVLREVFQRWDKDGVEAGDIWDWLIEQGANEPPSGGEADGGDKCGS